MGVAHVYKCMGTRLNYIPSFVTLRDIDCIFGLDAGKEAGFITSA